MFTQAQSSPIMEHVFPNFQIMLPNITNDANRLDKKILQSKKEKVFCGRNTVLEGWKWKGQEDKNSKMPF